jgi:hypothetical protein
LKLVDTVRFFFAGSFAEFFTLAGPRGRIEGRTPAGQELLRTWWQAARARLRIAEQLSPETELAPAVALYREGITALIGAGLVAAEGDVRADEVTDIRAAWPALARIWPSLHPGADLGEFRVAREALCEPARLDAVAPGKAESFAVYVSMARLAELLERAIEPRTLRQLERSSKTRKVALAAAAVIALVFPVVSFMSPVNLALHRPVIQSSVHQSRTDVGGAPLVNGKIEFTYGTGTYDNQDAGESNPWMMVDLGRPTRIGKIVVYNRGDGWFTDCLPLVLEVGTDTDSFKELATRTVIFTRTDPWIVDHLDETVRYVRARKAGKGALVLNELEVYAP